LLTASRKVRREFSTKPNLIFHIDLGQAVSKVLFFSLVIIVVMVWLRYFSISSVKCSKRILASR